jgi:hypothetical protein
MATMSKPGTVRMSLTMSLEDYETLHNYAAAERMPDQVFAMRAMFQYMARYPRDGQGKAKKRAAVSGDGNGGSDALRLQSCSPEAPGNGNEEV